VSLDSIAAVTPPPDGVYPEIFFQQRLDEEVHRAYRMHGLLTAILIEGHLPELAHKLRVSIRRMDVIGQWKGHLAVLLAEIPREEVAPVFGDRLMQQAQGVLRISNIVDTEWQEIALGACILPDQKGGKVEGESLLGCAEKALAESGQVHTPVLYHGLRRFIDTPRKDGHAPLLRFGDLHVSKEELRVWIGSTAIDLLPKEMDLLLYLLRHEGKLIRRDNLCKVVWGYDYYGTTRTVDMHIAKLRKKLQGSRNVLIRTLKGEGYRLEVSA
jgi:hypothetical protein